MKSRIFAISVSVMMPILLAACSSNSTAERAQTNYYSSKYKQEEEACKGRSKNGVIPPNYKQQIDTNLARGLLDADSRKVRFKDQRLTPTYKGMVCGYVNAKNTYGGYAGDQRFVAMFDQSSNLFYMRILDGSSSDLSTEGTVAVIMSFDC